MQVVAISAQNTRARLFPEHDNCFDWQGRRKQQQAGDMAISTEQFPDKSHWIETANGNYQFGRDTI